MVGTAVKATIRDAVRANVMVRANGSIKSRTMPVVNTIGKKTQMVVSVDAMMAPATCFAPWNAARGELSPR